MAFLTVAFGPSPAAVLEGIGLKLSNVRGDLALDDRSWFEPPTAIVSHLSNRNFLQIGAFCSLSGAALAHCEVGRYCAFAPEVIVGAHEHPTDWLTMSRVTHVRGLHGWDAFLHPDRVEDVRRSVRSYSRSTRPTRIGNDVWIGQRSYIRPGVAIGDGAVIAAGSVVTRDVPPYAVMAGVPARQVKQRFPDPLIERLLESSWWQYDLYEFDRLPYDRVEEALDRLAEEAALKGIRPYAPAKITAAMLAERFAPPADAAPSPDRAPAIRGGAAISSGVKETMRAGAAVPGG